MLFRSAMLLAEKNEYVRSIELLNQALKIQPSNVKHRLNLAKIYVNAGDKVRARVELDILSQLGDKFVGQAEVSTLLKDL